MPEQQAVSEIEKTITSRYRPGDLIFVVQDSKEIIEWGTRNVVGTHRCMIKVRVDEGFAYICSMLDNLGKGAASQAVENMNLMLGFPSLHGINPIYNTKPFT